MVFWQKIKGKGRIIFGLFVEWLFPKECCVCGKNGEWLCQTCELGLSSGQLNRLQLPACQSVDELFFLTDFNRPAVASVIKALKYKGLKELSRSLAGLMAQAWLAGKKDLPSDCLIVPLPLYPTRLRWRGFNQAEELAVGLSRLLAFQAKNVLARIRPTKTQAKLDLAERLINVSGAFACLLPAEVAGQTILLVDDVVTTGASINEAAKVLSAAGAKKVIGLAFAHGS
jgi:ComF family protein